MITEITRRNIFDVLRFQNINWSGRLNEPDFLGRIFDLKIMPSFDGRFKNAAGDIWQHRINNPNDWENDWIFFDSRFNLLQCDDELFLSFLCEMIHPVVRDDSQEVEQLLQWFNKYLTEDGYEIVEIARISGYPIYAGKQKLESMPIGVKLAKSNDVFTAEYLSHQINRIEAAIPNDPDLAIGTSKELVETCCKTILQERGIEFNDNWELTKIVKETYRQLKLSPDDIPETIKASDTIKRLLSNLATVTQGLAELRNSYGTGHGKSAKAKGLSSRHAKLAAGVATTLAIFLFETHKNREE
jgi:hypothetical protein